MSASMKLQFLNVLLMMVAQFILTFVKLQSLNTHDFNVTPEKSALSKYTLLNVCLVI